MSGELALGAIRDQLPMGQSDRASDAAVVMSRAALTAGPLRLLHVAPLPPPWTGIGVSLQSLLESAPLRAQRNWVIDTSLGQLPGDPRQAKRPTLRRLVRHVRIASRVAQMVRRHHVDVVHLHGSSHDLSFLANALSISTAALVGARTVWHIHDDLSAVQFPGRRPLTRGVFSLLARLPDALVLLSERDRATASRFMAARKLAVLPPTCDPAMADTPLERTGGTFRVLYVGWLTEAKGIFELIEVARRLRTARPSIEFDVLGTGMTPAQTEKVRSLVALHGMEATVHLWGVVTGGAKRRMFESAHVLFMPTHWDAFPVTVLEAMAAGLPIVATRVGGLPLMLDGRGGAFLTEVADIPGMVQHLADLAADPQSRARMAAINRDLFLTYYHPDRIGQAAICLYRSLLEPAPGKCTD